MTATLVDTETEVLQYTQSLCEVQLQDYIEYSIRGHQKFIDDVDTQEYHQRKIDELKNGECAYSYVIESGRKYHKVIMVIDNGPGRNVSRSVHCFIDKKTGEVYKSASWKSPAKGVRYNLLNGASRDHCYHLADWNGTYLYR
jgi:hypothetical protein